MSRKLFFHSLTACVCLFSAASLTAQQALFTKVEITPNWVYDPGFSTDNVVIRGAKKPLKWLELDIKYNTAALRKPQWLDNLTIEYRILLPKEPKVRKPRVILSGKVEYWAIAMDGKEHHAQAFVHPRFLQRYAPGLRLKKKELKDIRINVTFIQNESAVGRGVYIPPRMKRVSPSTLYKELKKVMGNMTTLKINHSVFSRDETPWGIIDLNYYELIKRKK